MIRDRSTVKLEPGLFLQPFIVSQLAGAVLEHVVEGTDLSPREYAVTSSIGVLRRVTPTELARVLGLSPTTLSAMLERLVGKGQVRKVPHAHDGRSYELELTDLGVETNVRNSDRFVQELERLRVHLEGDADEVLEALRRLEAALRVTLEERT